LKVIRFHDARHTPASLLLRQGIHPKIVQERLGHSSIATTLDTYSHVTPGLQEAVVPSELMIFSESVIMKKLFTHFEMLAICWHNGVMLSISFPILASGRGVRVVYGDGLENRFTIIS